MKKENFNIVIVGVGGQGQLTLLQLLAAAALAEKKNVKTSELHGLSQRGGSVEVHIRFGNVFSPLVSQGQADLILALELQEALRALYYCSSETKILLNDLILPIPGKEPLKREEILNQIRKFTKNFEIVKASEICKEKLGNEILAGVFLLSFSIHKKIIPLKPQSLLMAIKKIISEKYLETNLKVFELSKEF